MLRLIVKRLALLFAISFVVEAWKQRDEIRATFRVPVVIDPKDMQRDFASHLKATQPWMVQGAVEEIMSHMEQFGYDATATKYDKGVVDEIIKRQQAFDEFDTATENLFQRDEIIAEQAVERHLEDGGRDSV